MVAQLRRWLLALGLLGLGGCGGKAHSSDGSPAGAAPQGGSAGAAQGGSAGAASVPPEESPPLDDFVPWFTGAGDSEFPSGQDDQVLHIIATGSPAHFTLSTHNHYDPFSYSGGISFSARSSAPTRLLVSASNAIQAFDYFEARSEGKQWPVAPVDVTAEWQDFSVSFSDMMPTEAADSDGIPSFWLAFIVEHPEPVEVWLDDVRFVPKQ